jgi:drug/metabolite transporter (DMT)-like permease
LLHIFAAMSMLLLVVAFSSLMYVSVTDQFPKLDVPDAIWEFGSLSFVALIWLWIRMLVDFFRERPPQHPVAWGWFLFLGSFIGGIAYFWAVWRPRNPLNGT